MSSFRPFYFVIVLENHELNGAEDFKTICNRNSTDTEMPYQLKKKTFIQIAYTDDVALKVEKKHRLE